MRTALTCTHCALEIRDYERDRAVSVAGGTLHSRCVQYWKFDPRNPARPRVARFSQKPFGHVIASDGMPETYGYEDDALLSARGEA